MKSQRLALNEGLDQSLYVLDKEKRTVHSTNADLVKDTKFGQDSRKVVISRGEDR